MNYQHIISKLAGDGCVTEYKSVPMVGKLNCKQEKGSYAILEVPKDFVNKVYDAIYERGMEKPEYDPHISVMTDEELKQVGKIKEDGEEFYFTLDSIESVKPLNWDEMERVWFIKCKSPDLEKLRKKYGLTSLLNKDHDFHITVAVKPIKKKTAKDSAKDVLKILENLEKSNSCCV